MSQYLFVFFMEVLSRQITFAVNSGSLKGIKLSRHGLKIFHLCFAIDLLLFGIANEKQATVRERTFLFVCRFSGKRVNMEKSYLEFLSNILLDTTR